jgi:hypothetical protein
MKTTCISLIALSIAVAMTGPAHHVAAGEQVVRSGDRLDQVTAGATDISVADRASKAPFKEFTITKKTDSASNEEPIEIVLPDRGSEGRSR